MDNLFGKKEPGTYDYLEKENKKLVSELSNSTKKIEQLNNTIVQLNNKINALTNKNNEYEKLIKRLTDENKNLVKKNKNKDKDNNFGDIKKGNEQKDELLLSLAKQIEIKDNEINRLNKEINKYKSIIPFEIKEGEELLPVIFYSTDKKLHYSFICKNTEKFGELEIRLYELYPQYEETDNCFYVNENKIKRGKTLKENNIKCGDVIMVRPIDD
jgi:predicted RNase H-like nuclease (RuvC/YqgF family)